MQELSIEILIEQCSSKDPSQQIEAIQNLVNQKANVAVPIIIGLLQSPDDVVRLTAATALGELGTQDVDIVGSALTNLLSDPECIVRSEAVDALGMIGYNPAIETIKLLLHNDPEAIVRASAAESLGDLGDVQALEDLALAMLDPDESVRAYTANAIGLLGIPEMIPIVQTYIDSESSLKVKAELFGAKCRLGVSEDFNLLLNLLDNTDEDLAIGILNLLTDLMERKVPAVLVANTDIVNEVLTRLSQRLSVLSPQAEMLITQLIKISD
jgi:HEAT repeat protein